MNILHFTSNFKPHYPSLPPDCTLLMPNLDKWGASNMLLALRLQNNFFNVESVEDSCLST